MKRMIVALMLLVALSVSAKKHYKYRICFSDKQGTEFSINNPHEFLSERALERRTSQHLAVDETDLPVSKAYLQQILSKNVRLVHTSKWNNTALVELTDTSIVKEIARLPFVKATRLVWIEPENTPKRNKKRKQEVTNQAPDTLGASVYGDALQQIAIHNGDKLHEAGFKGSGMTIAVIDGGFYNVDAIDFFKNMQLLGTHDFANVKSDIFAENAHGMMVLSCMAANMPQVLTGTAPEASYWLLRSEDADSEQPVEEDNWAAAIEFADSVGVDVINTSLGYHTFDEPHAGYRYRDLDGYTSLISNSASMAADKGMIVVCSAGNAGKTEWKKVTPPGDAEHVLTVGATTREGVNAEFSSVGNSADGRVKPEVMAVGVSSAVSSTTGTTRRGNGTSFASPIFCGLVACFWQACPWLSAHEVIDAIRKAGSQADYPDNIYGYGIPDMWKAYQTALQQQQQ